MVGKDFVKVISPISADGTYQFWEQCRTGRMPLKGECKGEEYNCSFTFDIGYPWRLKSTIQNYGGPALGWEANGRAFFADFRKIFIQAVPTVFARRNFKPGALTAVGYGRRPSKGKWDFTFTGVNVKIEENFILAKLMDKEQFEAEIWQEAIRLMFPDALAA